MKEKFPVLLFFSGDENIGIEQAGNTVCNIGSGLFKLLKRVDRKVEKTALAFYTLIFDQYEYKEKK